MEKYIILLASVLIQTCIGGLYAWSEFVPALTLSHNLSTAQTQLIFGSLIAAFTVSMVVAGRILSRVSPRWVAFVGGLAFGGGYWIASESGGRFDLLFLGIGIVAGIGTGFCYVCPLTLCARWFPDRKGLVTGIAVAGFGGGAVLLSYFGEYLFSQGFGVLAIFKSIGMLYGMVIIIAALPLHMPEGQATKRSQIEFKVLKHNRYFWGLALGMFAGTFAGLLVIGNLKPMILSAGVSNSVATIAISAFAAGNALGRISWGWVADQLGSKTILVSQAFLAVMLLLSWIFMDVPVAAIILPVLLGAGFGACFVVYATQTASHYGADHFGTVYPLVFLAYGLSGLVGPWIGGWFYDHTQNYSGGFLLSFVVLVGSIAGSLVLLGFFKIDCSFAHARTHRRHVQPRLDDAGGH